MKKHYTIPFFIPHKGCPHKCVFCNQKKIAQQSVLDPRDIPATIEKHLATISSDARIEVGFFGGTFTGLSKSVQGRFLEPVQTYLKRGEVHGIRVSTRPDFINKDILAFLKMRGVICIELGVQSMSDVVLFASKRGHTAKDVETASAMIISEGFTLGHQIMLGLPRSTSGDEYFTARRAKELGAHQVRIYPVIVMKETELAGMWDKNRYTPLTEKDAARRAAHLVLYFELNGIKVLRCGLHPSRGLLNGDDFLSGPFHQAFGLKVESLIFSFMLDYICKNITDEVSSLSFNPKDESAFFGFDKKNLSRIKKIIGENKNFYKKDEDIPRGALLVTKKNQTFLLDRKTLYSNRLAYKSIV